MSADSVDRNSVQSPDKRFDDRSETSVSAIAGAGESRVKKIDGVEIPLEMAKAQLGRAFRRTVRSDIDVRSKSFGDPGQVSRLGSGDWPEPLINAWRRVESRRELLRNLARESGLFSERVSLEEKTGTDD